MRGLFIVALLATFSVSLAQAQQCLDLFVASEAGVAVAAPTVEATPSKPKPKKPAPKKKRQNADELADAIEAAPQIVERVELSRAELQHLVIETRRLLRDQTVTEDNVFTAIYSAKREFEAQINGRLDAMGQSITTTIRAMRRRRLQFAAHLKTGDTIAAIKVYRSLWESFYISRSRLLEYINGNVRTRDAALVRDSKHILLAITKGTFSDLKNEVESMYRNRERPPTVNQVLSIYDRVYARTNDEYRYAKWYFDMIRQDATVEASTKTNLDYIYSRLNVDEISKVYGIRLLKQDYLDSDRAHKLLHYSRPQLMVWWLKYSSYQQVHAGWWLITKSVVQNIAVNMTSFLPSSIRGAVRSVLMLNYNSYVISVHLESIDAVINAPPGMRQAVFESALAGRAEHAAQFLETLARLSSNMGIWNELRANVNKLAAGKENYKVLQEQMVTAEKGIKEYGWITTIHETSAFDTAVGLTIRGGAPALALMVTNWDVVANWTVTISQAATGVAAQGWETVGMFSQYLGF